MKLEDKGPIVAPPVLEGWSQNASMEIQSWPNIISATHWRFGDPTQVDGADFYVGEHELGHIHLDGEIHLVVPQLLAKTLIKANHAQKFRWGADWVQFPIIDEASARHAVWLFRLSYDHLNGTSVQDLMQRIDMAQQTSRKSAA
jgi:Family of unknown function (DUF5519)